MAVDPDHDIQRPLVLDRRGDDHLLHPPLEIGLKLLWLQELAGAFQHDVTSQLAPVDLTRRGGGAEADILAADRNSAFIIDLDGGVPAPVHAVEFEKVGRGRGTSFDLVHVDDVETIAVPRIVVGTMHAAESRPECQPAHAAHAVDAGSHRALRQAGARAESPISSRRFFSAIRSSDA
jgi:hypothetical protein